jgi:hypothetical protein
MPQSARDAWRRDRDDHDSPLPSSKILPFTRRGRYRISLLPKKTLRYFTQSGCAL